MSDQPWKDLKGKSKDWQFRWQNGPPVFEPKDDDELKAIANEMRLSIVSYDFGNHPTTFKGEFDKKIEDWNDHVKDAVRILNSIIETSGGDYNVVYRVMGEPVGILCVTTATPECKVDWLVTHPGVEARVAH